MCENFRGVMEGIHNWIFCGRATWVFIGAGELDRLYEIQYDGTVSSTVQNIELGCTVRRYGTRYSTKTIGLKFGHSDVRIVIEANIINSQPNEVLGLTEQCNCALFDVAYESSTTIHLLLCCKVAFMLGWQHRDWNRGISNEADY